MLRLKGREGAVKAEIPKPLYMAIVRVQAAESLDWEQACLRAAELLDRNSQEFKQAVRREALRLHRSKLMKELNKARETIRRETWESACSWVRHNEDNFRVPCSVCGKPMHFSSRDENWDRGGKSYTRRSRTGATRVARRAERC